MFKKLFAIVLAVIFVFAFLGCGNDSSTDSSSNILPEISGGIDYTSAYDDFHNVALDNDFDTNYNTNYTYLFQNWLYNPLMFFEVYEDFKDMAIYNSSESRWEATVTNPFGNDPASITLYGEYEGDILRIYSTDELAGEGLYIYPDGGIKIYMNPDSYIKFEIYKGNNYYYGFIRFNFGENPSNPPYVIKFKFAKGSPCTYFDLYFFEYSGSTNVGDYPLIRDYSGSAEDWYADRTNVNNLWFEINWDDPTFTFDSNPS